jgi:hypothetical protein
MDTRKKGDAFEQKVFNAIKEELSGEKLGLSPTTCQLYQKKSYYSRDRASGIIVDISIEVWLPNAEKWSILWVCECKDYSSPVPVNDLEEFKAKLNQIAGVNIKGVFATSCALQKSALSYARSNGIGIIRMLPGDQIKWIMHLMTDRSYDDPLNPFFRPKELDTTEFYHALTIQDYESSDRTFFGSDDGYIFGSWGSLLHHLLKPNK